MGSGSSLAICSSSTTAIAHPAPPPQSIYCHHCRGVISSGPSAFLAGQGRFGLNGNGLAECPRCRGNFVEVLTEHERRRIQVASPLRQVRVAATNIMPGRRVTANDIVYTFFLFDNDVHRDLFRESDLDAAISQSLDEAAASPQKATSKGFVEQMQRQGSNVQQTDLDKQDTCPVCEENLVLTESILRLPCSHVFHENCLLPWLTCHNTCPICRLELPHETEEEGRKRSANSSQGRRNFGHVIQGDDTRAQRPPTPIMEAAGIRPPRDHITPFEETHVASYAQQQQQQQQSQQHGRGVLTPNPSSRPATPPLMAIGGDVTSSRADTPPSPAPDSGSTLDRTLCNGPEDEPASPEEPTAADLEGAGRAAVGTEASGEIEALLNEFSAGMDASASMLPEAGPSMLPEPLAAQ